MKKSFLLLLLLLSLGLSGCLPKATAAPTPTATLAPVSQPTPTTGLTIPSGNDLLPDSGCTVVTRKPTPGATPETIFPPVDETDHVKGPADAKVTIIEYSDFQ